MPASCNYMRHATSFHATTCASRANRAYASGISCFAGVASCCLQIHASVFGTSCYSLRRFSLATLAAIFLRDSPKLKFADSHCFYGPVVQSITFSDSRRALWLSLVDSLPFSVRFIQLRLQILKPAANGFSIQKHPLL